MAEGVSFAPSDEYPGWTDWIIGERGEFNRHVFGHMLSRLDDPATARIRIFPDQTHANNNGVVHGGAILALIDMAIYPATIIITGKTNLNVVTVDLHTQFITPGGFSAPIDAVITLTQETGRMCFTRGTLVQDEKVIATFNALQRKIG